MSKRHDFGRLDKERAQLAVGIQAARDLASLWIGLGDIDENEAEPALPVLPSATAGLGTQKPTLKKESVQLERLRKTTGKRKLQNKLQHTATPKKKSKVEVKDDDSDDDDEEESRTTVARKRRSKA